MKRRWLQALMVFLLMGCLKLPVERLVSERLKTAGLQTAFVDLGLWENLGQMGFAASLGGLRALVASVTYMQAYLAFEDIEWARVDSLFQITNRLQPRDVSYWDEASWHMAYNAASNYLHRQEVEPMMRGKLYHAYIDRGVEILEEGLKFNPDDIRLLGKLGDIYSKRKLEPQRASEIYQQVADLGGPPVYQRLAAYELIKTAEPEAWRRAYEMLSRVYAQGQRFPSVITGIKELQTRLRIPLDQQVIRDDGTGK